jgi:TRAP transporter TAXI family solute receptor
MKLNLKRAAIAMSTAALVATGHAALADTTQLNMGGSTTTSGFYPYYTAIGKAVSDANDDLNVTVVSLGGFVKNDKAMRRGELDFAGFSANLIEDAIAEGYEKYRVLWWAVPSFQNVMVRKDSGVTAMGDLKGKCFNAGVPGATAQKIMLRSIKAIGLEPDIALSDSKASINAIKDGRCLGQMKTMGGKTLDAATASLNVTTPLWPIGWTDEEKAKIKAEMPWIDFGTVPAGIVEGAPAYDVNVMWIGFVATSDLDEEIGYEITKGMWENIEDQRAAYKGLGDRNLPEITVAKSATPLHSGAVRFYREIGLDVPEALVPPEMN